MALPRQVPGCSWPLTVQSRVRAPGRGDHEGRFFVGQVAGMAISFHSRFDSQATQVICDGAKIGPGSASQALQAICSLTLPALRSRVISASQAAP